MSDFREFPDLASERLGGAVLWANDEFFAEKENLLRAAVPVWREHEYTDRGKWMDGWETRRRRTPGFDVCLIRLGLPGRVRGIVVNTAFFRGNYPDHFRLEGCYAPAHAAPEFLQDKAEWVELLPQSGLKGDSENLFEVKVPTLVSHLRFSIFPDGGVARLRVHGEVFPVWQDRGGLAADLDLAALESGAQVLECSDNFFGPKHNLIQPGRAPNMGDGWETRRRRGPGNDWVIVRLAGVGQIDRVEIDTNHFKGNYPDTCSLEGILAAPETEAGLAKATGWQTLLPKTKLQAHTRHFFGGELTKLGPVSHVRLQVFPDGGVSRLRVWGRFEPATRRQLALGRLNGLPASAAAAELRVGCVASRWVDEMVRARPFVSAEALLDRARAIWAGLGEADWREAFSGHPRIGQTAGGNQGAQGAAHSHVEQAGVMSADTGLLAKIAEGNLQYEKKFGHIYLVCAAGKSAAELLQMLNDRMKNAPADELKVAAAEQAKITRMPQRLRNARSDLRRRRPPWQGHPTVRPSLPRQVPVIQSPSKKQRVTATARIAR